MNLLDYRTLNKWTQEQAAGEYSDFLGREVKQGTWSKWERGEVLPGAQHVFDLARWTNQMVLHEDHVATWAARKDAEAAPAR